MNAYSDHPKGAPGSPKAVKNGCTCPVMDNAHGKGFGGRDFWIHGGCPIHGYTQECTPIPIP